MVARGAKRPRSELRGLLQAFQPLLAVVVGARRAEDAARRPNGAAACRCVGGAALLCGFYLNELLLKLLPREDPHPQLFADYEAALADLADAAASRRRCCAASSCALLAELGYALPLAARGRHRRADRSGRALPLRVRPRPAPRARRRAAGRALPLVRGATLLALADAALSRTPRPPPRRSG